MMKWPTSLVLLTGAVASTAANIRKPLNVVTWNIAAVNNNPFEYWIEHDDERYSRLMKGVETFMSDPKQDIAIEQVFSQSKFDELQALMRSHQLATSPMLEQIRNERWEELKKKPIVSGFLKDDEIGKKRLASMPDRLTNTIATGEEGASTLYRPTPINCCQERFESFDDWWAKWKRFMFEDKLPNTRGLFTSGKPVVSLLKPIPRAKYPSLTEDDERLSLPLQVLHQAIFDSILVHMLNSIDADSWQDLRMEMCQGLNLKKNDRILEILTTTYQTADVICLQEVGKSLIKKLSQGFDKEFWVAIPEDSKSREQNSVVLLRKTRFAQAPKRVQLDLGSGEIPVESGDLLAVEAKLDSSSTVLVASFHGDTDGLATIPVLNALSQQFQKYQQFIFGLDANSYANVKKKGKQLHVEEFREALVQHKLKACFEDLQLTTYNARTFLQPQLNKGASRDQFLEKGDVNPKDFILVFDNDQQHFENTVKDNTGDKKYLEGMAFPTLKFPSDHGAVSTTLVFPHLKSEL